MTPSRRRKRLWALAASVILLATACSATPSLPPEPAPVSTAISTPDYGAVTAGVERAITSGSLALDTIGAVVVTVDGATVVAHYRHERDPDRPQHVFSVTKSHLSALIGIAIGEGLIRDVDAPLTELLPRHRDLLTGDLARITLRHLLTMSAGFPDDEPPSTLFADAMAQDGDAVAVILKRGLATRPGETFAYSNSSSHLVSAVLTEALRRADGDRPRSVLQYGIEKLFRPLGIDTRDAYAARLDPDDPAPFEAAGFGWPTDVTGVTIGAGGLRLRPADMIKIGQLYLDGGRWQGRQLVPESWVAASIAPSPANDRYGFLWWLDRPVIGGAAVAAFDAIGAGGQLVWVVPQRRLVVAVASEPTDDAFLDTDDVVALVSDTVLSRFS